MVFARNEETFTSDIDILVRFRNSISLLVLARIKRELSEILGKDVDLITESSIRNERLRKSIYNDLKIIFGGYSMEDGIRKHSIS